MAGDRQGWLADLSRQFKRHRQGRPGWHLRVKRDRLRLLSDELPPRSDEVQAGQAGQIQSAGQIQRELGVNHEWPIVIVGAGNLGQALANYGGFVERGFGLVGVFDTDPSKIGTQVGGICVQHLDELSEVVQTRGVSIGVLATPAATAQEAVNRLVRAGVGSILNFVPIVLSVPRGVHISKVDLAGELQILSYYEQQKVNSLSHIQGTTTSSRAVSA